MKLPVLHVDCDVTVGERAIKRRDALIDVCGELREALVGACGEPEHRSRSIASCGPRGRHDKVHATHRLSWLSYAGTFSVIICAPD